MPCEDCKWSYANTKSQDGIVYFCNYEPPAIVIANLGIKHWISRGVEVQPDHECSAYIKEEETCKSDTLTSLIF